MKEKSKRKVQGVPQSQTAPFPDPKRKRKPTNPNKRGNRNAKRTEKHKTKIIQGKTYNKSPR